MFGVQYFSITAFVRLILHIVFWPQDFSKKEPSPHRFWNTLDRYWSDDSAVAPSKIEVPMLAIEDGDPNGEDPPKWDPYMNQPEHHVDDVPLIPQHQKSQGPQFSSPDRAVTMDSPPAPADSGLESREAQEIRLAILRSAGHTPIQPKK